jgi:hypothetical protein
MKSLPDWKDIPAVEGMPHGCAWGLWDKPGEGKDQLGALNLLTPEVVREAIKEVQTGARCALKYGSFLKGLIFQLEAGSSHAQSCSSGGASAHGSAHRPSVRL